MQVITNFIRKRTLFFMMLGLLESFCLPPVLPVKGAVAVSAGVLSTGAYMLTNTVTGLGISMAISKMSAGLLRMLSPIHSSKEIECARFMPITTNDATLFDLSRTGVTPTGASLHNPVYSFKISEAYQNKYFLVDRYKIQFIQLLIEIFENCGNTNEKKLAQAKKLHTILLSVLQRSLQYATQNAQNNVEQQKALTQKVALYASLIDAQYKLLVLKISMPRGQQGISDAHDALGKAICILLYGNAPEIPKEQRDKIHYNKPVAHKLMLSQDFHYRTHIASHNKTINQEMALSIAAPCIGFCSGLLNVWLYPYVSLTQVSKDAPTALPVIVGSQACLALGQTNMASSLRGWEQGSIASLQSVAATGTWITNPFAIGSTALLASLCARILPSYASSVAGPIGFIAMQTIASTGFFIMDQWLPLVSPSKMLNAIPNFVRDPITSAIYGITALCSRSAVPVSI